MLFNCDDCGRDFGTRHGLAVHRGAKHPRPCPVCKRRLISDDEVWVHLIVVHRTPLRTINAHLRRMRRERSEREAVA